MKVAIIGAAGGIGQALSLLLKNQLPINTELSLYDIAPATPGIAKDLSHIPTDVNIIGFCGDDLPQALDNADIVLISAGLARKPGMERAGLFNANASIVHDLAKKIIQFCPKTCIGVITNPINSTVPIVAKVFANAELDNHNKLFGITNLDTLRAQTFIANSKKNLRCSDVKVQVIGGHSGITILPLLSQISQASCFNQSEVEQLTKQIQEAGDEVVKAKAGNGSATLAMAQAATQFCLSLIKALSGEEGIVECAYVDNCDHVNDEDQRLSFFARPVLLGKAGIVKRLPYGKLNEFEQSLLNNMRDSLIKDIVKGVNFAPTI